MQHSKIGSPMSALGHKRTLRLVNPMSALPRKRTSLSSVGIVRSVSLSAAMERSARLVVVLLLRHLAAAEFSETRDRLFGSVEPINTYAVFGVGVFRDLEHIGRSVVVKFHG